MVDNMMNTKRVAALLTSVWLLVQPAVMAQYFGKTGSAGCGPVSTPGCGFPQSYCPVPVSPCFGSPYPIPSQWGWGWGASCIPGFTYGFYPPIIDSWSSTTIDFGAPFDSSDPNVTKTGRSATDRIDQLTPSLTNDRQIPDTRSTSEPGDMTGLIGDVFKKSGNEPGSESGLHDEKPYKRGADLCKKGEFHQAIELLNDAIAKDPTCQRCFYVRSFAKMKCHLPEEAMADARQAIALNPQFAPAHYLLGCIFVDLGKLQDALSSLTRSLDLNPKSQPALIARANVYYRMGNFSLTVKDLDRLLDSGQKNADALRMMALSYFLLGQYQMAVDTYSRLIALGFATADVYMGRGGAYYELALYQKAIDDYTQALVLDPKSIASLYRRCLAYWQLSLIPEATSDAGRALDVAGWKSDNAAYLALCLYLGLMQQKRADAASKVLDDAIARLDASKWPYPILQFFKGQITEAKLLQLATNSSLLTQAKSYIGLWLAWTGKRPQATPYFDWVHKQGDSAIPEYALSEAQLFKDKKKDITNIGRPVHNKYALVIGVSKFADPTIDLRYADKDARDFYNYLVSDGHFSRDNVKLLVNQDATRENILSSLGDKWLPRVCQPDDLVLVYLSTHGSPAEMDSNRVNYLLAHNTDKDNLYATGIPLQDLSRMIKDRIHADRIVVVLDACHSGAADTKKTGGEKGLYRDKNISAEGLAKSAGQMVICSSQPDESSWESKKYPNGVFTHHLIDGLKLKGMTTRLDDAFEYTKKNVEEEVYRDRNARQIPVLKSTWTKSDIALAVSPQTMSRAARKQ